MALPNDLKILWDERDVLKHLLGSEKQEIAKWFNILRNWGKYNMLTTNLTPYFTDAKNVLRQELAPEILNAMDEEGEGFDYETFLKERYPQVKYIHDNSQKMRDIMTRLTLSYMQENNEDMSTANVNSHFDRLTHKVYTTIMRSPYFTKELGKEKNINEQHGMDFSTDSDYARDSHPYANKFSQGVDDAYFDSFVKPEYKKIIFKQWDKLGKADYGVLKYFDIIGEDEAFDNVADVVYPLLVLEWLGGIENTDFAQAPWMETSEMGFNRLRFKVEPVGFDYLYDESVNFGESGYACWDIRVLIDKDGDNIAPGDFVDYDNLPDEEPFIQSLFPESSRNKLSSFRNYNEDQMEIIESLWEQYEGYRDMVHSFCRVEVVLV